MDLGPYVAFIVWAYAAAGLIIAAVLSWLVIDGIRQRRHLAELEERGVSRRSAKPASGSAKSRDRT